MPLVVAVVPGLTRLTAGTPRRGWLLFAAWQAILLIGVTVLWGGGRDAVRGQMVWIGGARRARRPWLTADPARSRDPLGADRRLPHRVAAAGVDRGASDGCSTIQPARASGARAQHRAVAGAGRHASLLSLHRLGRRFAGPLPAPPRATYRSRWRLWALRGVRISLALGWIVVAALAVFSVAGTCDYLVFMRAVWAMGEEATAAGCRSTGLTPAPAGTAITSTSMDWSTGFALARRKGGAMVGLLLCSRYRFGVRGGRKATSLTSHH